MGLVKSNRFILWGAGMELGHFLTICLLHFNICGVQLEILCQKSTTAHDSDRHLSLPVCRSSSAHGHCGHQEPGDQQCQIPQLPQPPAAIPPQQYAEPQWAKPEGQEDQRQEEEADQG